MERDELIKKLETLERPEMTSESQRVLLKVALLNARQSSWIGLALVAVPCLFLFGILLNYGFGFDVRPFRALEEWIAALDRAPVIGFLPPAVLVGGPLLALALNLLAILHVYHDESRHEVLLTIKLRSLNLLIVAVCTGILAVLFVYAIAENAGHRAREAVSEHSSSRP